MATKLAFIGAGIMGAPMARNCAASGDLDVRVWNRTREKAEAVEGAEVADSAAAAVEGAALVVTMLADGNAVEAVARDFLPAAPDDVVWLQMSTVGLEAGERLRKLAGEHGIAYVDAPVSGTKEPAEKGELVVLVSGPPQARERGRPVFDAVGAKTVELGDEAGAGTRLKLVLNAWLVALVEGLAETIAFAESIGVDPASFLETIEGGPLGPAYAQLKGKAMIEREFPPSFPLSLALKDARLVLEAAKGEGLDLPLIETIERQFGRAVDGGHGDEDMAAAIHGTVE
ncbi:MAG: 3-hydroxyisobutyrate dehydrogenase [Thermoleophilaceae bacterium]|nr:3-hydroxyisobutyrate dehydrogenase [Thermoleophilaceae bacterium]